MKTISEGGDRDGLLERNVKGSIFQSCAMSTYEILFDRNIPKAVAINEAVELAKIYCDEGSPRFINGCLGRIANSAANDELRKQKEYSRH